MLPMGHQPSTHKRGGSWSFTTNSYKQFQLSLEKSTRFILSQLLLVKSQDRSGRESWTHFYMYCSIWGNSQSVSVSSMDLE